MFKKKMGRLSILLALLLAAVITIAMGFYWDFLFVGRDDYRELTLSGTPAAWTQSPREIGLDFAASCVAECQLEEIRVFQVVSSRAMVVLGEKYLAGDSVDARQVRIEFLRVGGTWRPQWIGERWQCSAFRGNDPGWTIEPCP
ncbi:MAG TPA: hypothetical protein VLX61_03975 [Anaerolineales bacterium]|nr:hypothetical protein [Anaerolineales bacterium]